MNEQGDIRRTPTPMPDVVTKTGVVTTVIGVIILGVAAFVDSMRFLADWMVLLIFLVTIGLGALFLVALEHTMRARWSVPFRRISEHLSAVILVCVVFTVPIIFGMHTLFEWTHADVVAGDPILNAKAPYLNTPFFMARMAFYFIIWVGGYLLFTGRSLRQDDLGDPALTLSNRSIGPPFLLLFAITTTFAAFDWIMSLTPHWYSTALGVYVFSGAIVAGLAVTTLASVLLKQNGMLPDRITRDHFYNLGALLFAMNVFWAYIAFSQFMLIWYGNLPEETVWYAMRADGWWGVIGFSLIGGHALVPFVALLSRDAKMNFDRLRWVSIWVLVFHLLDIYWMVLPSVPVHGGHLDAFSWMDAGVPLLAVGVVLLVWKWRTSRAPLIAISDPRLEDGMAFHL
jgi:hypothetical protein